MKEIETEERKLRDYERERRGIERETERAEG